MPTTYIERFTEAVTLLCGGKAPDPKQVSDWLDESSEDLQGFAASHGPSWGQGIALLDAAALMADEPEEGAGHLPKTQEEVAVRHPDGRLHEFTLRVGGKPHRCECGCNVFHKPDRDNLDLYKCNGCKKRFEAY